MHSFSGADPRNSLGGTKARKHSNPNYFNPKTPQTLNPNYVNPKTSKNAPNPLNPNPKPLKSRGEVAAGRGGSRVLALGRGHKNHLPGLDIHTCFRSRRGRVRSRGLPPGLGTKGRAEVAQGRGGSRGVRVGRGGVAGSRATSRHSLYALFGALRRSLVSLDPTVASIS